MKNTLSSGRQAFTLIEIIVSVTIIMVLTAIGVVSYVSINKNARNAKRRGDIEQIRSALEMYRSDNGYYPARNATMGLATNLLTNPVTPSFATYMSPIPSDPKEVNEYLYQATDRSLTNLQFYGYCLAAMMELSGAETADTSACSVGSTGYTYSRKNP